MNYVEKLFDEVHYAFNLNAATLSGAIDILVIPQLDGSLKCTPFHVRFGKLQLIQSSAKVISIYVNGQKTDLQMKLGQAGEAFFVEESDEPVPDILATSPIPSPKGNRRAVSNGTTTTTTTTATTSATTFTASESLSKLNYESEYPTLQHSQFHHNHHHNSHNNNQQHNSLIDHFSISLSLCGHLILDKALQSEPEEKEAFFIEYLISFEHFCSDATLLKNPHLVAKINDQYYPWSIAGHIILSYLIYRRPITQESLNNLKKKDIEDRLQIGGANKSIESNASNANNTATAAIAQQQPPTKQSSYWRGWLWKNSNNVQNQNQNQIQSQQQHQQQLQQQISPSSSPPSSYNNIPDFQRKYTKKTLKPTSDQLKSLGLKKGINRITFVVSSTLLGTKEVSASIYLWDNTSKIVISDIDGTITKSDVFGQVLPLIGKDWSHIGVAELYSNIKANGYQIIYLTSRAIGQANLTRTYISSVKQTGSNPNSIGGIQGQSIPFTLPEGPVFMSPNRLLTSFNREVIRRNPEEFKIACLQDIQNIFPTTMSPFYAGFGNRNTDAISYNAVGVPKGKTFTINALGVINTTNTTYNKTYTKINELVQDMFPCQNANRNSVDEQWNEYHYWKKSVIPLNKLDPL
ncbi:hypothetical protein DICPUDRAFT_33329 [Dictyostelium purpureum]|uniref:phosphatidate phosphatase n=1 Tax=Dictyostelium purpureum TaxID=5786 RepID=F0ZKN0_DICPU|nr:uncharacterized protein DICPUDRAFT_33329 [Dictyostelium purpureum]EGC35488.1 hypothetical protein DICPUDRAFT_33329 [Dictyostelium purpureum]|eukprot:XP_003287967.1 hypothetical protein DICPUDRAFT_33329 [Dictyostelium purpureum]